MYNFFVYYNIIMNNIIIFYTILLIIIMYILASTIENFQTMPAGPTDQIKEAVKQIYLADVESIRNLSAVATNLQKDGGLVTPANMSIRGKLSVGSAADIKTSLVDLLVENPTAPTTVTLKTKLDDNNITLTNTEGAFKISNKTVDLFNINKDGNVMKNGLTTASLTTGSLTTTGDIISKGKADITGALTTSSIIIGTPATGAATAATSTATAATGAATAATSAATAATGAVTTTTITPAAITTGSITATDISGSNRRNKAQYIIIGNHNKPGLAQEYWSLIEIEVYDVNGMNVIKDIIPTLYMGEILEDPNNKLANAADGMIFKDRNFNDNMMYGVHAKAGVMAIALRFDLKKEYYLDQIVIYNRYRGDLKHRLNGTTIELYDKDAKLVDKQPNPNIKPVRTIQTGLWNQNDSKEYLL
jgi:ribosomal protein L23